MPQINYKIDFGHILTIILVAATVLITFVTLRQQVEDNSKIMQRVEIRVDRIEEKATNIREKQLEIEGRVRSVEVGLRDHTEETRKRQ